ncbi:hypothetical protein LCL87_07580 [Rhodococcus hoagii]|nr:hypothetical protein [Prescottella equi]
MEIGNRRRLTRGLAAPALAVAGMLALVAPAMGAPVGLPVTPGGEIRAWGGEPDGPESPTDHGQLDFPALTGGETYTAIAAGTEHSIALTSSGRIVGAGTAPQSTPPPAPDGARFTAISAGPDYSLALTSTGDVLCFGSDAAGQCSGPADSTERFTAIAAGYEHSLALTESGQVRAFGTNEFDEMNLPTDRTYTAIAAGADFSLALTSTGEVVGVGKDWANSTNTSNTHLPPAPDGERYVAIAAGESHALALTSGGRVVAGGYARYGQNEAPDPPDGQTFTAVAAGRDHSLALTSDGGIVGWGGSRSGQRGEWNEAARAYVFDPAPEGLRYTAIAGGADHTLAIVAAPAQEPEPEADDCAATGSATSGSLQTGLGSEASTPVSSSTFGSSCSGSAVLIDLGSLGAFVGS